MIGFTAAMTVASLLTYYAELPRSLDDSWHRLPRIVKTIRQGAGWMPGADELPVERLEELPTTRPIYFDAPPFSRQSIRR